jgi:hypothetical protein
VPLHISVGGALETSGWFNVLDLATSILSLYSVCSYIAGTYTLTDSLGSYDFRMVSSCPLPPPPTKDLLACWHVGILLPPSACCHECPQPPRSAGKGCQEAIPPVQNASPPPLTQADFVMGIIFAAEWLFRLWLAPSRVAHCVSFNSTVDLVTFLPMLILTHFDVLSLATACFRMLRIARIFK